MGGKGVEEIMKPKHIPTFSETRKVLFSKTMPPEEIDAYGQVLLDDGRTNQALDFFEKTKNKDKIRLVVEKAREAGDASVWLRGKNLLGEKPTPEMWEGIAERALALGKERFAAWAYDQAGRSERAEEIRAQWHMTKKRETE